MNMQTCNIWLIEFLKGVAGTLPFEPGGRKLVCTRVPALHEIPRPELFLAGWSHFPPQWGPRPTPCGSAPSTQTPHPNQGQARVFSRPFPPGLLPRSPLRPESRSVNKMNRGGVNAFR